ncbi:allantoate amidohydrolase [Microbacterium sp. SLBN-154]|uniref:allantoate amidohydrolase n=1 Tax=Microbacterium sp. SLBN-154 TaxID=2768458 RepID=UPI001150DA4B|nr:allantoate amidohydrolase [Microbacterium sp. SLBN-154]
MDRARVTRASVMTPAERVMARCDELARISSAEGGIERVYLSPEHARVNRLVAEWMREAGMTTRQDAAGNLIGRAGPAAGEAPALVLGSHLDTVPDAGRYDGIAGVLMAIEVVRALRAETLPFALEVVAFWDEEGTRFGRALLGSSAAAGVWDPTWWELTDAAGATLREAFLDFGLDPGRIGDAARASGDLVGYLEAHIEQGPELDEGDEPLAVVSSIASARRFRLDIAGEARHAGGTPYDRRRDALLGAAEIALAVERVCRAEHHIVGTVGELQIHPGAINVVPGDAHLSLDLRGEFDGDRDRVWRVIQDEVGAVTARRGLTWSAREVHEASAVFCDPLLQDVVGEGIRSVSPFRSGEAPTLFSRAGHDGMAFAAVTGVGMLFLRNPNGISHHPEEAVSGTDVDLGIRALAAAVRARAVA